MVVHHKTSVPENKIMITLCLVEKYPIIEENTLMLYGGLRIDGILLLNKGV